MFYKQWELYSKLDSDPIPTWFRPDSYLVPTQFLASMAKSMDRIEGTWRLKDP